MSKFARIAVGMVIVVGAALLLAPFFIGMYVERANRQLISFFNSPSFQVQIADYHRGWFTSDATIIVSPTSSPVAPPPFFAILGINSTELPTNYMIDQHIQHGPLFYQGHQMTYFGLALIHNRLRATPAIKQLYQRLGLTGHFFQQDEDIISFGGNYFKHFMIAPFQITLPHNRITLKVAGIEGQFWVYPLKRITGSVSVNAFELFDGEDRIQVPRTTVTFDQYKSPQGLWLGSNELVVPQLEWQEINGNLFSAKNIDLKGDFNEKANQLSGFRQFDIGSIKLDNEGIGPLHLEMSVMQLNAQAIADVIAVYREVMQRGEVYQSQLQQKMYMMLPKIINPGSKLQINKLSIKTPDGDMSFHAELSWPDDKAGIADDLFGLVQDANVQLHLQIAKKLTEQFILFASGISLLNQYEDTLRGPYTAARAATYRAARQNAFLLANLIQQKTIKDDDARHLLALQKKWASLADYNEAVKNLFLQKNISRMASYQLSFQYTEVSRPLREYAQSSKQGQIKMAEEMHAQLQEWLRLRYILQDKENYELSISRTQGKLEINHKKLNN